MTVIELGDVGAAAPDPEEREKHPEFNPRTWRRVAAIGVTLLCLLVLGASGLPGPPTVREVWSVRPNAGFAMTVRSDGVFVHQPTRDGSDLVAYDLADGTVQWRLPFDRQPTYMSLGEEAGLLLIPGDEKSKQIKLEDGSTGFVVYGGTTTAIDARTGQELWRGRGEVLDARRDALLFAERGQDSFFSSIWLVRPRDGSIVWRRDVTATEQVTVPQDQSSPDRIVTADSQGKVTVVRYADGKVVHEAELPWSRGTPGFGYSTYLSVTNGLVMTIRQDADRSSLIEAYRLDTLEELWRREASAYAFAQGCGPLLCLSEETAVSTLEPLTGRPVWQQPGYSGIQLVAEDRVLASLPGSASEEQVLLDLTTGRKIGSGATGWPLQGPAVDGSQILVRRVLEERRAYSSISHLDLETGRVVRIGEIPNADGPQCMSARRYMACDQAGELTITAVG
ncbi:PQQ-binding-like beta-propeller repeat protein [Actinoplanes sp. NBC_00393]|uniref:outer membrane protein assembly factor BamB family protein n=1 Tax=Actinoplanes sp. NBC_00393 TaxID=2975953 RepID=UPI002E200D32